MENFINHDLSPYEMFITRKNQNTVALALLGDLHFGGFLELVELIAKKVYVSSDKQK